MRNIIFISLTLIQLNLQVSLFSQELNIVVESGLGSYRMTDLREINSINLTSLNFDAKQTENFPSFWRHKSSFLLSLNKLLTFGVTLSHESTGSRISRADYSGEYFFDTRIRAYSPGAIAEFFVPARKFRISFCNEAGIEYSKLRLNEYLRVNSQSDRIDYIFTSKNYYYEPSIRLSYPIWLFRLAISAGYLFDLKKGTFQSTDPNKHNIHLPNGELAVSDWSGVRMGISFSYNILQAFKLKDKGPPQKAKAADN